VKGRSYIITIHEGNTVGTASSFRAVASGIVFDSNEEPHLLLSTFIRDGKTTVTSIVAAPRYRVDDIETIGRKPAIVNLARPVKRVILRPGERFDHSDVEFFAIGEIAPA
jgi:hypothetical protein